MTNNCQTRQGVRSFPSLPNGSTQSGFTIVEALVAMMIAAVLLISLTPIVVLSVATRVQARRVDLATQAARSYIDGLRADVIEPPNRIADFSDTTNLNIPAPQALPTQQNASERGITCVDKNLNTVGCRNANNPPYLVIQSFRNPPKPATTDPDAIKSQGYCIGVRVYRADAFANGNAPAPKNVTPLKNMFTETSDTKNHPLVVMRSEILNQTSFETYKKRFPEPSPSGSPSGVAQGSPCG